jgi:small GTP-binding protein
MDLLPVYAAQSTASKSEVRSPMEHSRSLRRYWPEMLLFLIVALPWLSLIVLGSVWLWQSGVVWRWSIAAAVLALLAWPLVRTVRRRAKSEARHALADLAEPSGGWNAIERDAWSAVLQIADTATPLGFADLESLVAKARETVEVVAHRFHPETHDAWAQFTLPEFLLLTERLCRDIRREALRHIPAAGTIRLSYLLWAHRQNRRYGVMARTGWRMGFGLWRLVRAALNPLQALGQETSGAFVGKTVSALSYRVRVYATRLLVLEVGRAAIDLYAGRLVLTPEELEAARNRDTADASAAATVVRIVLVGQVNAGKSSLLNSLAQEVRGAVGPLPTTPNAAEYLVKVDGRPTASFVDTPGFDERMDPAAKLVPQAERADLILWVASAIQPARGLDRERLDEVRVWARKQLSRRTPPILLALTHVDELRPAAEWTPPYDIIAPAGAKARAIRAAMEATARALDVPATAVVPVAMPPNRAPYNLDALWARIAVELDEAKLVQFDRLRIGQKGLSLRTLAEQLGRAGRTIIKAALEA